MTTSTRFPAPRPTHDCPGKCGTPVAHHLFACPGCWRRLPDPYRRAISGTYLRNHHDHAQAMVRAMCWFRDNPHHTTTPKETAHHES